MPELYYIRSVKTENKTIKQRILDYAGNNGWVEAPRLVTDLGVNINTARQYLCDLSKDGLIVRAGNGEYRISEKQVFKYRPSERVIKVYKTITKQLPFTDFCVYDGSIFTSLQHNVAINNAVYVETDRDAVDSVFALLKGQFSPVYKRPDANFMYDYVKLQEKCFIVKALVTESPLVKVDGIYAPTLEKLLVDIQKDDDFDYMQGTEMKYIYQTATDQYDINIQKMLRYARRRVAFKSTSLLLEKAKSYD